MYDFCPLYNLGRYEEALATCDLALKKRIILIVFNNLIQKKLLY